MSLAELPDAEPGDVRNLRLTVAYDGTDFCGWQLQPDGRSVQGELHAALLQLTGRPHTLFAAGRTDAGVHALGQVVSFETESRLPLKNVLTGLTHFLPPEISILAAAEADAGFHAQFAARWKRYRYIIDNSPQPGPFLRRFTWQMGRPLDASAMHAAAQTLVGTHDFRSFETDWPNKRTSVRTVYAARVFRTSQWPLDPGPAAAEAGSTAPFLCYEVTADGFLYNMVRAMVGSLVNVGRGRWPVARLGEILAAQNRIHAGDTAPARGLFLAEVSYEAYELRGSGGTP